MSQPVQLPLPFPEPLVAEAPRMHLRTFGWTACGKWFAESRKTDDLDRVTCQTCLRSLTARSWG